MADKLKITLVKSTIGAVPKHKNGHAQDDGALGLLAGGQDRYAASPLTLPASSHPSFASTPFCRRGQTKSLPFCGFLSFVYRFCCDHRNAGACTVFNNHISDGYRRFCRCLVDFIHYIKYPVFGNVGLCLH